VDHRHISLEDEDELILFKQHQGTRPEPQVTELRAMSGEAMRRRRHRETSGRDSRRLFVVGIVVCDMLNMLN
jgi:hypothetical protein